MNQNKDSNEKRMPNKVAMYLLNLENALQYIEIENPLYHWKVRKSNYQE